MNFFKILAWILPTPSVDKAVSILTKAAAMLAKAEAAQNERLANLKSARVDLDLEIVAAVAEVARAKRVAANFAALTA